MKRRAVLVTGAVAAAAGVGFGLAWRGREPVASAAASGEDAAATAFFASQFASPSGGPVSMSSFIGRGLLVNFWATWCAPCVEELPLLDRFYREQADRGDAGWHVLGLAIDEGAAVRAFIARLPVSFPIALAGPDGISLARRLGNTRGGLPFSVVFDARQQVVERHLGPYSSEQLRRLTSVNR